MPLRSHGSLSMNRALLAAGLVDRVQVTLFPVITGQTGRDPIFQRAADFDLELIESRTLDGNTQELIRSGADPVDGRDSSGGALGRRRTVAACTPLEGFFEVRVASAGSSARASARGRERAFARRPAAGKAARASRVSFAASVGSTARVTQEPQ